MGQLSMFGDIEEESSAARNVKRTSAAQAIMFTESLEPTVKHMIDHGAMPGAYAAILATSNLDVNQQYLALRSYSNAARPTLAWFSKLCRDIYNAGIAPLTPLLDGQESLF